MKKFELLIVNFMVVLIVLSFTCCVSTNYPINPETGEKIATGIVALSVGRPTQSLLDKKKVPIIGYDVFPIFENNSTTRRPVWRFAPEPRPVVYYSWLGQLGKGKYGFIHFAELPVGKYFMVAKRKDSAGYGIPLGNGQMGFVPGASGGYENAFFYFEIMADKINYIGELLTVKPDLTEKDSVVVDDFNQRDLAHVLKKKKLKDLEVVKNMATRIELKAEE